MVNAACDASVHFTPTKVSQPDCTLGTTPGVFIASTYSCTRAARHEKRKLGILKIIGKRLIGARSRYFLSFPFFFFNLSPRQLNFEKNNGPALLFKTPDIQALKLFPDVCCKGW